MIVSRFASIVMIAFSVVFATAAQSVPFSATGSFTASGPNNVNAPATFNGSFSFVFDLDPFSTVSFGNFAMTALNLSSPTIGGTTFDFSNVRGLAANDLATPEVRISVGGTPNGAGVVIGTDDFFATFRLSGVTLQDALNASLTLPLSFLPVTTATEDFVTTYSLTSGEVVVSAVPEPGTFALLGLGLSGLACVRRCRAGRGIRRLFVTVPGT